MSDMVQLWYPDRRSIDGISLGASRDEVLARGDYFEDASPDIGGEFLYRFTPDMILSICDGIVVSIGTSDECFLDGTNLIGLPFDEVAGRLGGIEAQLEAGEIEIYATVTGVELYVRDGKVTRIVLSDWSLVPD